MELSGYDFEDVYKDLHISRLNLGCVMMDTEKLPEFTINEDLLYYSKNPEMKYVQGQVSDRSPHVTLLYGIQPGVKKWHVDRVLEGWELPEVKVKYIDHFDPELPNDPYYCVVAHLDVEDLIPAHKRLSFLPHVNTYQDYKAHLTLAYIDKRAIDVDDFNGLKYDLFSLLNGVTLKPLGINYGSNIGE